MNASCLTVGRTALAISSEVCHSAGFFCSIDPASSWSITRPCRSEFLASSISSMISGSVVRAALDRPRERVAAQRAEPHPLHHRHLAGLQSRIRSSSTMISVPSRSTTGRTSAK